MLGVDLVSVQRISRLCEREWYRRFWFDENERDRLGSSAHADESYAAGVAMKEAVMKAFGHGFGQGVQPRMITLEWSSAGRPRASLQGHRFAVSATHSDGYAVATALDLGGIR